MPRMVAAKYVAPRTEQVVRRPRVLGSVKRAAAAGACWIAAPAGYGKTTAAAEYLNSRRGPRVWYRVDEGDQDIASFFHYMAHALPKRSAGRLPVFGAEYADQPLAFARRYFRAWWSCLGKRAVLVLDDLHRADSSALHSIAAVLLQEAPADAQCLCVSRMLPGREFTELKLQGRLRVLDQAVLKFSEKEARVLVASRLKRTAAAVNVAAARGWAAGLVLLTERAAAGGGAIALRKGVSGESAAFAELARELFDTLPASQADALLKLSVLPQMRLDLARALVGEEHADEVLDVLQRRQLLMTRADSSAPVFHFHDLLREYLQDRITQSLSPEALAGLRLQAARLLLEAGEIDAAVSLSVAAEAWSFVHSILIAHAAKLIADGRRATFIDWCSALPPTALDAWLCYWLGVAHSSDDELAERWLHRAWDQFVADGDARGRLLTAARAVLSKSDSWRTHEGLNVWTARLLDLIEAPYGVVDSDDWLLVATGMLRSVDFAADFRSDAPVVQRLTRSLLDALGGRRAVHSTTLRLQASATLMEHAGSTGQAEVFEQAVDSVVADLRDPRASPWSLGLWLVAFGAVSGRYFAYARRGFPYDSAEAALRAAVVIGERESLRGVEFGALYHLQLQLKARNDLSGFGQLIQRLGRIADSRYTTQVAVVADCEAAWRTLRREFAAAYRACERFNAAIEAANEPPIERWPHFITEFQTLLADERASDAAAFLEARLHLFDSGVRQRTVACICIARWFESKWSGRPDASHLSVCMQQIRAANWPAILLNVPWLLSELCADALAAGLESDLCRSLIERRSLSAPASRPAQWPWRLKVHVLGQFRLDLDDVELSLGPKPPTRALDIIRLLAANGDQGCSLGHIYERLWPDADGDQAKAAFDQALHRLRKLLGGAEIIVQREGKLRFAPERVWIDAAHWEGSLRLALKENDLDAAKQLFFAFGGPLFQDERAAEWAATAAERVRSKFIDLALRLARRCEQARDWDGVQSICLRALDFYPTSERCYYALLRARLGAGDVSGAVEHYRRYERELSYASQSRPSAAIRALVDPWLASVG